jgi:glucose-6-phosphate isomerase
MNVAIQSRPAGAGALSRDEPEGPHVMVNGPLGAHFLAWEAAVALAGQVIGINPFDQPNVTESKENTRKILASGPPEQTPLFTDGAIEVYADDLSGAPRTVVGALTSLLDGLGERGYLAVMAYLDRLGDAELATIRPLLAAARQRPVTFGWGPRFLHSTGQYHKGGPAIGSYLQITGAVTDDLDVPGQPYTFGQLQAAQAAGDRQALSGRGRPLLWLHLTDRAAGIAQLLAAARSLAPEPTAAADEAEPARVPFGLTAPATLEPGKDV